MTPVEVRQRRLDRFRGALEAIVAGGPASLWSRPDLERQIERLEAGQDLALTPEKPLVEEAPPGLQSRPSTTGGPHEAPIKTPSMPGTAKPR